MTNPFTVTTEAATPAAPVVTQTVVKPGWSHAAMGLVTLIGMIVSYVGSRYVAPASPSAPAKSAADVPPVAPLPSLPGLPPPSRNPSIGFHFITDADSDDARPFAAYLAANPPPTLIVTADGYPVFARRITIPPQVGAKSP